LDSLLSIELAVNWARINDLFDLLTILNPYPRFLTTLLTTPFIFDRLVTLSFELRKRGVS
jgi:hypothetical protein